MVSIDTTEALAHPKVHAVITGKDLEGLNLAWAPTLSADVQAVLATDKVRFQGQEVAFVVAEDRYSARDALELIDVEYEALPVVVDVRKAMDPGAAVIRDDKEGQTDNHIFDWEAGNAAETDAVFARADVVVSEEVVYPRVHPAPMETCGAIADYDSIDGKLTLYETTQAPHAHRTLFAMVAGIPEHKIRVVSPDIGEGSATKSASTPATSSPSSARS
ncbi:molybdopterin cofactor-binding domain-containing protein [Blastococcus brunescens]|uniref:Molybdopterin cofactor-binding domain-containing protein n=1 Tax=Blastococcus brunescens TaxID=1564165 RepID=A0ABZ1AZ60_9ACTN|nr:molybdopterin cofactor-binding domain-containing protein [Blastococcus sp. BMG 8361]WRL62374.1 molybdopterin cofactor-binding domain-containing protein [Blastococcus sp. BMG 8361]